MKSNIFSQLIYEEIVHSIVNYTGAEMDRQYFTSLLKLRAAMLLKHDPLIYMEVGETPLLMNFSHNFPFNRAAFPFYDTALSRLAKTIFQQDGYVKVIDVGANIGDTVSLVSQEVDGSFLCIEGDPGYFLILLENVKKMNAQITCVNAICAENDGQVQGTMLTKGGTGHFAKDEGQQLAELNSLDAIIEKNAYFKDANLLKIDTDGFDFCVLRGANKFLQESGATIFFEFSPDKFAKNGEQPLQVFSYLSDLGYQAGLLYHNFGYPLEVIDINDHNKLQKIANLEYGKDDYIGYYDVLLPGWNMSREVFSSFYMNEFAIAQKF